MKVCYIIVILTDSILSHRYIVPRTIAIGVHNTKKNIQQ